MRALFLAGFVALASAASARADTYTQQIQFGFGPTDFGQATGTDVQGGNGASSFYYFDTRGGTLNSIIFSSTYAFSSSILVTSTSTSGSSGSVRTESGAQFSGSTSAITTALNNAVNKLPGGVSFGNSTLSPTAYDIVGSNSAYNLASGQTQTYASQGSGSTGPLIDTSASDLAAFSAATGGTYQPLFSTLTGLLLSSSGGNVSASQQTGASGTLSITYNYTAAVTPPTPVPEPASLALLGVGLAGIAATRRRRFV